MRNNCKIAISIPLIKAGTIALICLCLFSCRYTVRPEELAGTYVARGPYYLENDTLIIYPGGTFFHSGQPKNQPQIKAYGTWQPTVHDYFELEGHSSLGDFKPSKNALTGSIKIFMDPDEMVYYIKIKPAVK